MSTVLTYVFQGRKKRGRGPRRFDPHPFFSCLGELEYPKLGKEGTYAVCVHANVLYLGSSN